MTTYLSHPPSAISSVLSHLHLCFIHRIPNSNDPETTVKTCHMYDEKKNNRNVSHCPCPSFALHRNHSAIIQKIKGLTYRFYSDHVTPPSPCVVFPLNWALAACLTFMYLNLYSISSPMCTMRNLNIHGSPCTYKSFINKNKEMSVVSLEISTSFSLFFIIFFF